MSAARRVIPVLLAMALSGACGREKKDASGAKVEPGAAAVADCPDPLKGAKPEVAPSKVKVDLPAVPNFDLPPPNADGSHAVKEMRVHGAKFFDQQVVVTGHVTWAYDCATAIRTPDMSDQDVKNMIDEDPTRCMRPRFRIGDTADAGEGHTIDVVEVPRPPTAYEKKMIPKDELKDATIWRPVPPLAVGDEVVVTGEWKQRAPHGEANVDGLLIYQSMTNVTQGWPK